MLDDPPYHTSPENSSKYAAVMSNASMIQPSMNQDWQQSLEVYLRCNALLKANLAFGPMAMIADAAEQEDRKLKEEYGSNFRQNSEVKARFAERLKKHKEIDRQLTLNYIQPLAKAIQNLVRTPAPDISAALFKVDLIERDDLDIFASFDVNLFQIVQDDMQRIANQDSK